MNPTKYYTRQQEFDVSTDLYVAVRKLETGGNFFGHGSSKLLMYQTDIYDRGMNRTSEGTRSLCRDSVILHR